MPKNRLFILKEISYSATPDCAPSYKEVCHA